MPSQNYILFDLGNVIVDWNPRYLYDQIIKDPERRRYFLTHVCNMDWHMAHDRGVSFAENAHAKIKAFPEFEAEILAWHARWAEHFNGYVAGMDALIDTLYCLDGVRLFGLSNISDEVWPFMLQTFPAIGLLEDVIVSGRVKLLKPDPKIYQLAWEMMGQPEKSDVLFIDDREENTKAAQAFGFHAHMFTGRDTLVTRLRETSNLGEQIL